MKPNMVKGQCDKCYKVDEYDRNKKGICRHCGHVGLSEVHENKREVSVDNGEVRLPVEVSK